MTELSTELKEEFLSAAPADDLLFGRDVYCRVCSRVDAGKNRDRVVHLHFNCCRGLHSRPAVLIADMLPFINRFPHRPLIYNVAWKTVIYFVISAVIQFWNA